MESISDHIEKTREKLQRFPGEPKTGPQTKFTQVPNSEIWTSKLNHREFRIYVVVLSQLFKKSFAEVGIRQIAKQSCMNEKTATKYAKILEEKEYWFIEKKPGHRSRYVFFPEKFILKQ